MKFLYLLLIFAISLTECFNLMGQDISENYIQELKDDLRGPYAGIRWFCEDGTMREARDPCPEPLEGVQHAIYKDKVKMLAERHHLFLDQILTGTDKRIFLDEENNYSRIKQYQITNFLFQVDDGWILKKAKNYRGAKQTEDEQAWGQEFLEYLIKDDSRLKRDYLFIRMATVDIPHGRETSLTQRVRALTKRLSEEDSRFMGPRTIIHNNPSSKDLDMVIKWKADHPKISNQSREYLNTIIEDLKVIYSPFKVSDLTEYLSSIRSHEMKSYLEQLIVNLDGAEAPLRAMESCMALKYIRDNIDKEGNSKSRVDLIDLSVQLENLIIQDVVEIEDDNLHALREKICFLKEGLYGGGYIEQWEYDKINNDLDWMQYNKVSLIELDYFKYAVEKLVQWSSQMIQSIYSEDIRRFEFFEPLAKGVVDDKIRSSLILPLGHASEKINHKFNKKAGRTSVLIDRENTGGTIGLNPGIAKGVLRVIGAVSEGMELNSSYIYAFDRPPSDLKPVAGILNVKEGNPVSHVQLLARNLGIPNALISGESLRNLSEFDGKEVIYAVSTGGTVNLKLVDDATDEEKQIFQSKNRNQNKIKIETDRLILHPDQLINMAHIGSKTSGVWCGPKAANLGQLKEMFPDHVVDGVVIPFGVFKDHMEQMIPGKNITYWTYLRNIFIDKERRLQNGEDPESVDIATLQQLTSLQGYIEQMPLKPSFLNNLDIYFRDVFNKEMGEIPVFIRSDTNMEDLPQFTGAGLNLTLFNVVDRQKILDGIKKVWASPYSKRSYQWRQKYLLNPEEVYPSILIIPSVNVDQSGVIITKGVSRGSDNDVSISFSRGVGGAVDGQAAESYVVYQNNYAELISPSRETKYRVIPPSGGSQVRYTSFYNPVLSNQEIMQLKGMAIMIAVKMKTINQQEMAYDIELGIKDGFIWLFQVRPFVENNEAQGLEYLRKLDPEFDNQLITLEKI